MSISNMKTTKRILKIIAFLAPVIFLFTMCVKFVPTCERDIYNCSDFKSYEDAKNMFDRCGNVNNLDKDKDGIPCEELIK